MHKRAWPIICVFALSSLILHPSSLARADGGAVRLSEQAGAYRVTVFTSPTPLRAGVVDFTVLVQDAATGECVPQALATLRLTARKTGAFLEQPATAEAATNKLCLAAVFRLPEPGWWDVDMAIEGAQGPARLRFGVQADEALPRWQELWPWFAWPALVVLIFSVHRALVRRAPRSKAAHPVEVKSLPSSGGRVS
jgi:hypothetical protein